ncbi:MAG: hypothetical protein L0J49_05740 [Lactococcus lactis]|nr:hypothetical protein [Lactococcus lactis]
MKKIKTIAACLMMLTGVAALTLGSQDTEAQNQNLKNNTQVGKDNHGCGSGQRVCAVSTNQNHR